MDTDVSNTYTEVAVGLVVFKATNYMSIEYTKYIFTYLQDKPSKPGLWMSNYQDGRVPYSAAISHL